MSFKLEFSLSVKDIDIMLLTFEIIFTMFL